PCGALADAICCSVICIFMFGLQIETKSVDLLTLSPESDVDALVDQIILEEPLLSDSKKDVVRKMIYKLMDKLDGHNRSRKFYLYKILRAHILPLTNCAFNKSGSKFITGSYDREFHAAFEAAA
ncbi:U4 u6 small nuclear ribonucleoprotein, partial [Perkinsus olseni]